MATNPEFIYKVMTPDYSGKKSRKSTICRPRNAMTADIQKILSASIYKKRSRPEDPQDGKFALF
jgi:hypothetical protein